MIFTEEQVNEILLAFSCDEGRFLNGNAAVRFLHSAFLDFEPAAFHGILRRHVVVAADTLTVIIKNLISIDFEVS